MRGSHAGIVVARGRERCTFLGRVNEYKSLVDLECFLSSRSMKSYKPLICFRFTLRYLLRRESPSRTLGLIRETFLFDEIMTGESDAGKRLAQNDGIHCSQ
jgi:hypothetical protein